MNEQINSIVELNARGLAMMRHGDYRSAGAFLGNALECLEANYPFDFYSDHEIDHDVELPFVVSPPLAGTSHAGCRCHEESVIGIFDRGISFSAKDFAEAIAQSECVKLCTSIALHYNIALCFHLEALVTPQNQKFHLETARTIYQMACGLLDLSIDQREALVLQFALMNNLASINAQLFDVREAHRWLEDLRFAYWSDAGELEREEREMFRSNLVANIWYIYRPSAAA
eukprot:scaffold40361_cov221-Amphora_coffeaeformis.AAC.10